MILRGWKDICKASGGMSSKTIRKLMRLEAFPVDYIEGSPQTTDALITEWVEKRVKRKLASSEGIERHGRAYDEPA